MKYYKAIFTLMIVIFGVLSAQSQCDNKISVSSEVKGTSLTGTIEVNIKSNSNYKCILSVNTAVGSTIVEEKRGKGNKKINFAKLELGKLYSVEVEFSGSKDFLCSKLSKTILFK